MKEIWKPVIYKDVDYTGDYEVSNLGRVKSFRKNINGTILKNRPQGPNRSLYYRIVLQKDSSRITAANHVLVWEAFNFKKQKGFVIHHKDGNNFNNKLENLAHISFRENLSIERTLRSGLPVGVLHNSKNKKYQSQIKIGKKNISLGSYFKLEHAATSYQIALKMVIKTPKESIKYNEIKEIVNKYRQSIGLSRIIYRKK